MKVAEKDQPLRRKNTHLQDPTMIDQERCARSVETRNQGKREPSSKEQEEGERYSYKIPDVPDAWMLYFVRIGPNPVQVVSRKRASVVSKDNTCLKIRVIHKKSTAMIIHRFTLPLCGEQSITQKHCGWDHNRLDSTSALHK